MVGVEVCVVCVYICVSLISCSSNRLKAKDVIWGIDTLSCHITELTVFS